MKKRGRKPSFVITESVLEEIQKMSGLGLTQNQIAAYYGISSSYWHRAKNKNKNISIVFKKGKSKAITMVSSRLMQKISEGNLKAIIFYLERKAGWKEKNTLEMKTDVKLKNQDYRIDTMDAIEASKIYQSIMTGSYKDERNSSGK